MNRSLAFGLVLLVALTGCGLREGLGTRGVQNETLRLYFRAPKNWQLRENQKRLLFGLPEGTTLVFYRESVDAQNEIQATEILLQQLRKELRGWEVQEEDSPRIDLQYARKLIFRGDDEARIYWLVPILDLGTVYVASLQGSGAAVLRAATEVEGLLTRRLHFTTVNPVLFDSPFTEITMQNYYGYMMALLALISVLFMGRYFFLDLWRLIRYPGDVFRDLARGDTLLYAMFWLLFAVSLGGAFYGFRLPHLQVQAQVRVDNMAEASVRNKVKELTTDRFLQEALFQDVRKRALAPLANFLDDLQFQIPVAIFVSWLGLSILIWLLQWIFRGQASFLGVLKATTLYTSLLVFAGFLLYWGRVGATGLGQYAGYVVAAWVFYLGIVFVRTVSRLKLGPALVILFLALGGVVGGNYYYFVQYTYQETVLPRVRSQLSPDRNLLSVFLSPLG